MFYLAGKPLLFSMTRPIKFRAKTVKREPYQEKWVYGYFFKTPLTTENFEADSFQSGKNRWCIADNQGAVYEIDIETLGQFTGLQDKTGKEIYEQDIYQIIDAFDRPQIKVLDDLPEFYHEFIENECVYESIEVIGNVYENADLLQ